MRQHPTPRLPLRRTAARVITAALLTLAALANAACSRPAALADDAKATMLAVSAHAEVRRAPDIATLSTGVTSLAPDANAAIRRNAEEMARVVAALRAAGIQARDVQTSGVSLQPDYQYASGRAPRIRGYHASNTVNVTVRNIGNLGEILDALVAAGANQVHGPSFELADRDAALDEARGLALDKARARADTYAKRLGLRVTRVASIDETGGRGMPLAMRGRGTMVEQAAAVNASAPISPGENVLGMTLDVVYVLEK
jgi:uncharacterized protein YggE